MPERVICGHSGLPLGWGADALVIVAEWEQIRALDLGRVKEEMGPRPAVVDLRNIYPPGDLTQRGFVYESVGRPSNKPNPSRVSPPFVRLGELYFANPPQRCALGMRRDPSPAGAI